MLRKNDIIELTITDITNEGNGIGRADGMAVFVPFSAVGDVLEVAIVKTMKNFCYGKINRIIKPSQDRIEQDCPVFGRCGGCSLRHINYDSELKVKAGWVTENLRRIGGIEAGDMEILPSPQINGYRNKAQLPVCKLDDKIVAGFYAFRSHRIVPCSQCMLQPDIFSEITEAILNWAENSNIKPYDELTHSGDLRHIYLRQAEKNGEIMVCLVSVKKPDNTDVLIAELIRGFPQITSIVVNINKDQTNVILGKKNITLYGKGSITDNLSGIDFDISPLSFFQVNRQGAEVLLQTVREFAGLTRQETLIDLYCGTGTIGLSMAKNAQKLIGIEIIPQAVENARANASRAGINNAEFICADAATAATDLAERNIKPDVIVLDPPRKGCDRQTIEAVCRMSPQKIVMVSCNSATMARDVKIFCENGYKFNRIKAVDMFPRTAHVECVVLITRAKE